MLGIFMVNLNNVPRRLNMKKKYIILTIILLIIFSIWINLAGMLWSEYSYELYCLETFIKNNNHLPKDEKAFNDFIKTKFNVTSRKSNYLIINYNIDISKLIYFDGKLYDNENKLIWIVCPQKSLLLANPLRWFSCKDDSIEIYEKYKEVVVDEMEVVAEEAEQDSNNYYK